MAGKIDQLEYTVMELGTEVFRLKSKVSEISANQEQFIRTLQNLKNIIEEKGIITEDDFEMASTANDDYEEPHEYTMTKNQSSKIEFH